MSGPGPGRFQRNALAWLASSSEGLAATDLMDLARAAEFAAGRKECCRVLLSLEHRGLAVRNGSRRPSAGRQGAWPALWFITDAGRQELARTEAERSRVPQSVLRLRRRASVAAALAAGFGPDTPEGLRKETALAMRDAGCRTADIALVFAVPEAAIERLTGGAS